MNQSLRCCLSVLTINAFCLASELAERRAPTPPPSQEQLRLEALASGPGSCDNLNSVREFPAKAGLLGKDVVYNRIVVHIDWYKPCLVKALADTTEVDEVLLGPGIAAGTVSDIAYALLVDTGQLKWGLCAPASVVDNETGAQAFYQWLAVQRHRADWQECMRRLILD